MDANLFDTPAAAPDIAARVESRLAALARLFWLDTLRGRVAAGAVLLMLLGMAITTWHMGAAAERELLVLAQRREQIEAGRTQAAIGRRVAEMQATLRAAGERLEMNTLVSPQALEAYFAQQQLLRAQFASLYVIAGDGRMLMLMDATGTRRPDLNVADRDYFRRTVGERRALVSEPVPSRISAEPIIIFTHPVIDAGSVQAVIGGALRLASRDLLEDLAEPRDETDVTLVVITDGDGRILAHPQHARLLQTLDSEPRLAEAFAKWTAAGRPLSGDAGQWSDAAEVVGMAGVAATGWRVWRSTPKVGVLAPLEGARRQAMAAAAWVALMLACAFIVFIARQLRPLHQLKVRAAALLEGQQTDADGSWPEASGEIGELSRTLRHVWAERAQAEAFNAQVLQKLSSVMAASPVGLAFTRHKCFELVSTEMCHMLGRCEDTLVGHPSELIFASHDDYESLGPRVGAAFAAGQPYTGEWQLKRADGSVFWARLRARPVVAGDAGAGTIWSMYDISDQVDARMQLEHAATHDELTGVLNRKGFEHLLHQAIVPETVVSSVVMIDLDHFKPVNDTAGHAAGDAMLRAVARAILGQVRASDAVGRLGGDEFALLLRGCDRGRAIAIAEKVRLAIQMLALAWEGRELKVGSSLGVAERSEHHETIAQWLAEADSACYEAKREGRNRVNVASGGAPAATLRLVAPEGRR